MSERVVHVVISGEVQGVGYRAWTAANARRFGLAGWVRNRRSGDVEAMFRGPADKVAAMVAACHQGPLSARVSRVREEDAGDLATDAQDFLVLPTA